jgi:hypothetical protein
MAELEKEHVLIEEQLRAEVKEATVKVNEL